LTSFPGRRREKDVSRGEEGEGVGETRKKEFEPEEVSGILLDVPF
jgi:hypothetical protein